MGTADGQRNNIDHLMRQIREAEEQKEMLALMAEAAAAVKQTPVSIDQAEKIHDDLADAVQDQEDVRNVLARPIAQGLGDEDELEAELAGMVADDEFKALEGLDSVKVPK